MILRAFFGFLAAATLLAAGVAQAQQVPFEIARLQKDFPVTLYSGASCKNACDDARAALNKRSIPFTEVVVAPDEESIAKLRSVSGSNQLPVLTVGRSVQIGFEPSQYDALLDSAGYPAAGTYPPRNQKPPSAADAQAKPAAKPPAEPKLGPYDTSGLKGPPPKQGPYDPSGLKGPAPKPGPYGVPAETK
jgi:glutaredoxin